MGRHRLADGPKDARQMPTLFISYKRGTAAVAPLMERLRAAQYRLWFDRDEIHLGDTDWQARINQGIERCDGLILNLTPAACASEPVQYEVKRALELKKPIFPIVLERISDWTAALTQVGLSPNQHTEDFTDVTKWDEQIQRLLRDLEIQGLRVTRHDLRQQRDRNNASYVLHQTYLKRLVERIGTLSLAQINPDNAQGVLLEQVYVDSPTGLSISVDVQDWQVADWWISEGKQEARGFGAEDKQDEPRRRPAELGYESAPLEALLGQVDARIVEHRKKYPNKKPSERHGTWSNGSKRNVISLHLNHLAAARDRLVILGAPGSGKSTFVKFLALCLAGAGLDDWTRDARLTTLESWPHGALTPVYVELRRFVASKYVPDDVKSPLTADHLWAYIQQELLGDELKAYADDLRYDLEHGHAVLILDGLDEVPYPEGKLRQRQQQLIALAQSLNTRYASSRIIVASRPYAYEGWTLPGFQAVTITAFADGHRRALASRLYQAAGLEAAAAQAKAQALNQQLQQIDPELKDRPLFVTLMATIYLKGESEGLPTRRGALYRASILLLLDRWTRSKPNAPSLIDILGDHTADDLVARLAALAYDVHKTYGDKPGTPEIDVGFILKHLYALGGHVAVDVISYLSENAGVLVCPGQNTERDIFHFAHRTFQEYLAAEELVRRCVEADSFELIREQMESKPAQWRVPCVLAGDVLVDTERPSALWKVIDDLLDDETLLAQPAGEGAGGAGWNVWLASAIVEEQKLHTQAKLGKGEKAIREALIEASVKLIETPQALNPPERAQVGRALGLLGDPRSGVGLIPPGKPGAGLPDIEWCDIPAPEGSKFWMGADDRKDNPRREAELKYSFKASKYLITYSQYQCFLDAHDFDAAAWWADMPSDVVKRYEQEWPISNHPREKVTWYQAVAFTRWLTAKYRAAGLLTAQEEIRLPTEFEWEYAARGTDGRVYPYGDTFDARKCNGDATGIGQTSAAGIFPDGASPFGLLDMSGNVWEWCLNKYDDTGDISIDVTGARRALRGGSFVNLNGFLRAAIRVGDSPGFDDSSVGFRCALFSP